MYMNLTFGWLAFLKKNEISPRQDTDMRSTMRQIKKVLASFWTENDVE